MEGHRARLPLAIVGAVVAAGVATLILRPRHGVIDPVSVETTAYFSPDQLERAQDYRGPQRALALGGMALTGVTLAVLALWPPRPVRAVLEHAGRRPVLGSAAAAAGISVLLVVVTLPVAAVSHQRAVDIGLSTQNWGDWLVDAGKSTGIGAVVAALGGVVAIGLLRRFPRHWWAPAAAAVVAFGVLTIYLVPVVIDPAFNKFEPLPRGELRSEVLTLAKRAGVDVGEVYRIDASRRTTGANAYVNGLGHTKRVVLYDTLIERFSADQVRSVVAHELAHVKHRDLLQGLIWLAIVAPAGTFLVQQIVQRLGRGRRAGPEWLPALALSVAVVSLVLGGASNVLSRRVEARADAFALRMTRDPAAFIELERRLALTNVSEPDPPELFHTLFGTHPTAIERIGMGEAWARD